MKNSKLLRVERLYKGVLENEGGGVVTMGIDEEKGAESGDSPQIFLKTEQFFRKIIESQKQEGKTSKGAHKNFKQLEAGLNGKPSRWRRENLHITGMKCMCGRNKNILIKWAEPQTFFGRECKIKQEPGGSRRQGGGRGYTRYL